MKGHDDFKFGTFGGHFQSEGTASMGVKGLKVKCSVDYIFNSDSMLTAVTVGGTLCRRQCQVSQLA